MTEPPSQLLAEALRLPDEQRGDLAARLIESLDPTVDADAEAAWGEEIRQRLDELDSGAVSPVPWSEARRQILDDADEAAES